MFNNRRIFIKQLGLGTVGISLLSTLPENLLIAQKDSGMLPRSSPEKQGITSASIQAFLDGVAKSKTEFHSIMVIRHGHVVAEGWWSPYAAPYKHTLYSLSKSFTSSAVGLAIDEGKFKLDSKITSFFPDEVPDQVSPHLAAMTVKDLLTMSAGHAKDTFPALRASVNESWVKTFLAQTVDFEPGTHFLYNSGATYMLSAIVQKTTGKTVLEYLTPRLFEPLGIKGLDWETDPKGIILGATGLRLSTEDIGKFGQLYLQKGKWKGQQLIPESWISDATSSHIDSSPSVARRPRTEDDWAQGYGYQFWRCRHNAYRADGAFGQFCFILPEKDAVVVVTEESFGAQTTMDLVWDHLLPGMNDQPLPEDKKSLSALQKRLGGLSLDPPKGNATSTMADKISGQEFLLEPNPFGAKSVLFKFSGDVCTFTLKDDKGQHNLLCGINKWKEEGNFKTQVLFPMNGRPVVPTPVAASVTWNDSNTLLMSIRYPATAHSDNITFTFNEDNVSAAFLNSVAKGNPNNPEQRPLLQGKASA